MKYQKLILSFLFLINCTITFSQKLILKETSLLNWNKDQGSLKYTYYEDPKTGNYISHGKFNYKLDQGTYYKELATGMLKNGKRDGLWNYNISRVDDFALNVYWTGNIKLTFGYKEGKPDGLWSYVNQQKYRAKNYGRWTPYEYQFAPNETLTVMFANGHPAGTYVYTNNGFSKTKITGQFNSKGFLHGSWVLPNDDKQTEYIFNNGILVKKIIREMPSGRIASSYIANENEVKLHASFLAGTLTKTDKEKYRIQIDTIAAKEYISFDETKTIYSRYFNWYNIEGDDLFNQYEGTDLGGKAIKFVFKPLLKLDEIQDFSRLVTAYFPDTLQYFIKSKIKSYDTVALNMDFMKFLEKYKTEISVESLNKVIDKQRQFKELISNISVQSTQLKSKVIGIPKKVQKLEVAQNDFPIQMNWDNAMKACVELGDGWHLPSKDEINILYDNKEEIGGFANLTYCSSTEFNSNHIWGNHFNNGWLYQYEKKTDVYYVRAVRSIK